MLDKEALNRRLRSWMVDAGETQESLAEKLGVTPSAVKGWIYGSRGMSLERACQICDLFGKSIDELACREVA